MSDSRPRIKRLIFLSIFVLIACYGLFEARRYLEGPVVHIDRPVAGETIEGPVVRISGYARNLSYLYINGAQAFVDENGTIVWSYVPPKGYTVLTAKASDRFGRSREVTVPFIVK